MSTALMTIAARRRWRAHVLLLGVVLLAVAAVLLVEGSRPQAREPGEGEDRREARFGRQIHLPHADGAASAGGDEDGSGNELELEVRNAVTGEPLASQEVSVCFEHKKSEELEEGESSEEAESSEEGESSQGGESSAGSSEEGSEDESSTGDEGSDEDEVVCDDSSHTSDEEGRIRFDRPEGAEARGLLLVWAPTFETEAFTAEETAALLTKGTAVARLTPQPELTVTAVDDKGRRLQDFSICRLELVEAKPGSGNDDGDLDDQCDSTTDGTYTITTTAGEYAIWIEASRLDEEEGSMFAEQRLRLDPGEQRAVELHAIPRRDHTLSVRVLGEGERELPMALVELELRPREPPASPVERAQEEAGLESPAYEPSAVSWQLRRAGWYHLKAVPRVGPDRPLAELDVYVATDTETKATMTILDRPARCSLVTAEGRPVPVHGYQVKIVGRQPGEGFGGSGSNGEGALFFFWPAGASSVEVKLRSLSHGVGQGVLHGPEQACELVASKPEP